MNLITQPLFKPVPDPDKLHHVLRWIIALVCLINGLWGVFSRQIGIEKELE